MRDRRDRVRRRSRRTVPARAARARHVCLLYISIERYVYGRYTTRAMGAMQDVARVAGALGEPSRLAILAALLEGEATVSDLATRLGLAQPRVSTHLARLRGAGLVTRGAMGRHRAYRADAAPGKPLLDALYATAPAAGLRPARQAVRERRSAK